METIIHIDGALPLAEMDAHGWTKGSFGGADSQVCAHGAIRLCAPVKGDAYLIERVEAHLARHSTDWNDAADTTEADVREWFAHGIDITDTDLLATFGPQWRAVVALVRRAADLTPDEAKRLDAASGAASGAAWAAASGATWDAVRDAARVAASDAAWAIATYDLATIDGPYTIAQRDLLLAPWVSVCGMPEGLVDTTSKEN